jgi:hypothetical protein
MRNSIGDAVISTILSGRVTYLNVVAERLVGQEPKHETGLRMRLSATVQVAFGSAFRSDGATPRSLFAMAAPRPNALDDGDHADHYRTRGETHDGIE